MSFVGTVSIASPVSRYQTSRLPSGPDACELRVRIRDGLEPEPRAPIEFAPVQDAHRRPDPRSRAAQLHDRGVGEQAARPAEHWLDQRRVAGPPRAAARE
jgi:hypothetical protein